MTAVADPQADGQTELKEGRVVAIAGPVDDVEFPTDALPEINQALEMELELEGETITIVAEVAQQIGESRCRVICMKPTDGLKRGTVVRNTGHGIRMPVGDGVLGHVFNVIGEPLDISSAWTTSASWWKTSTRRLSFSRNSGSNSRVAPPSKESGQAASPACATCAWKSP
jgi:F-type H+-transporting ATPase subunit beta